MPGQKPSLRARDFDPEVLRLFDQYVHGGIDRRGFSIAPRSSRPAASPRLRSWKR